jgi:hypothetical protein
MMLLQSAKRFLKQIGLTFAEESSRGAAAINLKK